MTWTTHIKEICNDYRWKASTSQTDPQNKPQRKNALTLSYDLGLVCGEIAMPIPYHITLTEEMRSDGKILEKREAAATKSANY